MIAMLYKAPLQAHRQLTGKTPFQHGVQAIFQLHHTPSVAHWRQFLSAVPQVNRFAQQRLHLHRPTQLRLYFTQPSQGTQLMSQTHLPILGGRLQLRPVTIAEPAIRFMFAHESLDHLRAAPRCDRVIGARRTGKDPMPSVPSHHSGTGFLAADNTALYDSLLDLFGGRLGGFTRTLQNAPNPSFTELNTEQIIQGGSRTLVTQMLFVLEIDHWRFQARPKRALRLQPLGQRTTFEVLAMWADDFVLVGFDDQRTDLRQLGQLTTHPSARHYPAQIRLTVRAARDRGFDDPIRVVHPFTHGTLMAKRGTHLLAAAARQIRFPIVRRWSRRVAQRGWRLAQLGQLNLQLSHSRLQQPHRGQQFSGHRNQLLARERFNWASVGS